MYFTPEEEIYGRILFVKRNTAYTLERFGTEREARGENCVLSSRTQLSP
jgi:hypothetical protein